MSQRIEHILTWSHLVCSGDRAAVREAGLGAGDGGGGSAPRPPPHPTRPAHPRALPCPGQAFQRSQIVGWSDLALF